MTQRTWGLLAVLGIVLIGAVIYFFHDFNGAENPASPNPFAFMTQTGTSAPSVPAKAKPSAPADTTTTTKKPSGYTVDVHGKTESITSTAAGVVIDAPVNSLISQANTVLSVTPPQSTQGEMIQIQKTATGFGDALAGVRNALNGTQNGFDAIRTLEDTKEYNPGNVVQASHIVKIHNVTVAGVSAVYVRVTNSVSGATPARDFYVTWVHTGTTNWYIVRTNAGITAGASSALDAMVTSIKLLY